MDKQESFPPPSVLPKATQQSLPPPQGKRVVRIFCCYAHEDEELLKKLKTQLSPLQRQGFLHVWYDRDISAGAEWEREISEQLNTAQIILLLISPDFMASDYCYSVEMKRALERHQRGEVHVIPVILRPVLWERILGQLQALPTDTIPVTSHKWESQDAALYSVAEGIQKVVDRLLTKQEDTFNTPPVVPRLRPSPRLKLSNITKIAFVGIIVGLLIVSSLAIKVFVLDPRSTSSTSSPPQTSFSPSATIPAVAATLDASLSNPYPPHQGTLVLNTSLTNADSRWNTSPSCQFTNKVYSVTAANGVTNCLDDSDTYDNFIYQVQMKFLSTDTCGGILLRVQSDPVIARSYEFYICTDNTYHFGYNLGFFTSLINGSNLFNTEVGQANVIAIAANGTQFILYINGQMINKGNDNNFSMGSIGVSARTVTNPNASHEVAFNNVKVWQL